MYNYFEAKMITFKAKIYLCKECVGKLQNILRNTETHFCFWGNIFFLTNRLSRSFPAGQQNTVTP